MKKFSISAVSLLFLAACGGSSSGDVACENNYWDGTVGTCLPAGWQVVDRATLDQRGSPPEVLVAFQAEKPVSGQFPTVTVTREALRQPMESSEYSDVSMESVTTLPGYEELSRDGVTINESDVTLHTFTAQPRSEEPKVRFAQVSIAKEGAGFTFTGAVPLTVPENVEQEIELILKNATLVEQEEE
jgi:hypothetical protein